MQLPVIPPKYVYTHFFSYSRLCFFFFSQNENEYVTEAKSPSILSYRKLKSKSFNNTKSYRDR